MIQTAKKQNYTQFASENGYPSDHDTNFQSLVLGGRGLEGKRQSNRSIKEQDKAFEEMLIKKKEGREAYNKAIWEGKIIDPDGKITRELILKSEYELKKSNIQSKIDVAKRQIKTIDGLGRMAHLENGKLKKSYQRVVDGYNETISEGELKIMELTKDLEQQLSQVATFNQTQNTNLNQANNLIKTPPKKMRQDTSMNKLNNAGKAEARKIAKNLSKTRGGEAKDYMNAAANSIINSEDASLYVLDDSAPVAKPKKASAPSQVKSPQKAKSAKPKAEIAFTSKDLTDSAFNDYQKILKQVRAKYPDLAYKKAQDKASAYYKSIKPKSQGTAQVQAEAKQAREQKARAAKEQSYSERWLAAENKKSKSDGYKAGRQAGHEAGVRLKTKIVKQSDVGKQAIVVFKAPNKNSK